MAPDAMEDLELIIYYPEHWQRTWGGFTHLVSHIGRRFYRLWKCIAGGKHSSDVIQALSKNLRRPYSEIVAVGKRSHILVPGFRGSLRYRDMTSLDTPSTFASSLHAPRCLLEPQ